MEFKKIFHCSLLWHHDNLSSSKGISSMHSPSVHKIRRRHELRSWYLINQQPLLFYQEHCSVQLAVLCLCYRVIEQYKVLVTQSLCWFSLKWKHVWSHMLLHPWYKCHYFETKTSILWYYTSKYFKETFEFHIA